MRYGDHHGEKGQLEAGKRIETITGAAAAAAAMEEEEKTHTYARTLLRMICRRCGGNANGSLVKSSSSGMIYGRGKLECVELSRFMQ